MNANDPRRVVKELRSWTNGRHMPKETPLHRVMSAAATLLETMPTREQVEAAVARWWSQPDACRSKNSLDRHLADIYAPPSQPEPATEYDRYAADPSRWPPEAADPAAAPTGDGDGTYLCECGYMASFPVCTKCGTPTDYKPPAPSPEADLGKNWATQRNADLIAALTAERDASQAAATDLEELCRSLQSQVTEAQRERDALAEKLKACEATRSSSEREIAWSARNARDRLQELFNEAEDPSDEYNALLSTVMLANVVVQLADLAKEQR